MKEFEKNNVLSDDELDNVSGGTVEYPWVVIETGEGANGNGKYTYQISYNKTTGERREERNYYWSDPNFSG